MISTNNINNTSMDLGQQQQQQQQDPGYLVAMLLTGILLLLLMLLAKILAVVVDVIGRDLAVTVGQDPCCCCGFC